ncbi:MAG: helix-turn-helix transcriptional regulator [Candidatus Aminicenantes bacterium]|nr:helix-turn-helix transcriptional regulator [Candidatus Aminicenantes bacterium]
MVGISLRFREAIKSIGKQKDIAKELGVSVPAMARYGKEGDTLPSASVMYQLHSKYNVNIHWLLTGEGTMFTTGDKSKVQIQDIYPDIPDDPDTLEILEFMEDKAILLYIKSKIAEMKLIEPYKSYLQKENIKEVVTSL